LVAGVIEPAGGSISNPGRAMTGLVGCWKLVNCLIKYILTYEKSFKLRSLIIEKLL
jgi:hypothetical protein